MIGQGDYFTIVSLSNYLHFNENYKVIVIHLCKHRVLDANSRAIEQMNSTVNLDDIARAIFVVIEEKTSLDF